MSTTESLAALYMARDRGELLTADQFLTLGIRAGRNQEPELLWKAFSLRVISNATLAEVIGSVWSSAEYPEPALGRQAWLLLFELAGYTADGKPADRPAGPVNLWRGSKTTLRRRMSWTADRSRAEWFAARYASLGPSAVCQVSAPPDALLCHIGAEHGRGEDEYVINTRGLRIWEAGRSLVANSDA